MRGVWSARLATDGGPWSIWTWNAFCLLFIVLAPARFEPLSLWNGSVVSSLLVATTFLTLALFLGTGAHRRGGMRLLSAIAAAALCYGAVGAFLFHRPDIRPVWDGGFRLALAAISFAFAPYVFRTRILIYWALATIGVSSALIAGSNERVRTRLVQTKFLTLAVTYYRDVVGPLQMDGGAIEPDGDSLLVVTGDGAFYRLTPSMSGSSLASTRLDLPAPFDRARFLADQPRPDRAPRLRVTDMLLGRDASSRTVFVAHQYWHADQKCFTLRVSTTPIEMSGRDTDPGGSWQAVFDSWPCLPVSTIFDDVETGGRLAWLEDRLLLTVGDHGFDGREGAVLPQTDDNAYGKTMLIDPIAGTSSVFTKGHRNPQGLLVDLEGQVWETEHGPEGGDEINLLRQGGNYGWPWATYGTDYGSRAWPVAALSRDHGTFEEPVHAFVPSIAISSLIRVDSDAFPEWRGDLLIGSLRPKTLYRVKNRGGRVIYVAPIGIGEEIRDLAEGPDGRIYIWTESGVVVELARGPSEPVGALVFERCRGCHEADSEAPAVAPALRGVVGRTVASQPGYEYSPALSSIGGNWTVERLDLFLADPNGFAPASRMAPGKVADPAERRAVVQWLANER